MSSRFVVSVTLAALAAIFPGVASAQDFAPRMMDPMILYGLPKMYEDHANAQEAGRRERAQQGVPDAQLPRPEAPVAMTYRPSLQRRRDNLAQIVSKTRETQPGQADSLAALFAQGDFIERVQKELAPYGVRVDNVADAYSIYWLTAYQAMKGDASTPQKPVVDAVRAQAGQALGATARFASASDAERQNLAEALWVQSALLGAAVDDAQGKPDQLALVRKAAIQGAAGIGLELERFTLTSQGFVAAPGGR